MAENSHFIQSVGQALALLGVDPDRISLNLQHNSEEGRVMLGLEDTEVALSVEGDTPASFIEDGWFVSTSRVAQLQAFHEVFSMLSTLAFEDRRRLTMSTVKQTSRHEQWLIDALLRRDIPSPDRNHKILKENGKELTVPDMAWPELKVAFFVDGLWWHQTREDIQTIEMLSDADNRAVLLESNRTRNERDGAIRSQMQVDGWKVLSCTDRQLESREGVEQQADIIQKVLARAQEERAILSNSSTNPSNLQGIQSIL